MDLRSSGRAIGVTIGAERRRRLKMLAPLRFLARLLEHARTFVWRFTGAPPGVHAIALTPGERVILVKLNYAKGWSCPGGGLKQGESPEEAIVRELQEEIGMTVCAKLERLHSPDSKHQNIFVVRGVKYDSEPSLEIRRVREFGLDDLPDDFRPRSWRRLLTLAKSRLHRST